MIEQKLQLAADSLPNPRSDYLAVEEKLKQKRHRPRANPRRRFAIVMVLAVLLVGCVAVASEPDYHLYNGNWWQFIPGVLFDPVDEFGLEDDQTMKAAKKLGISLPETLGGEPIISFGRNNLTTKKVPIQIAWLSPHYLYYSTFYGVETEKAFLAEDGTTFYAHTLEGTGITFGPISDDIWRRQFGYDENDTFVASNWTLANHPVVGVSSHEYEGTTIYVAQIDLSMYLLPKWDVTWVDYEKGVVFSLEDDAETPDLLIEYAQEIIDLNR